MKTYKGLITKKGQLPNNGVYCFGSNPIGKNGNPFNMTGGGALIAHLEFGVNQGEKMINKLSDSGCAYGIVTVSAPKKMIPIDEIGKNIKIFYEFANQHPELLFFVCYDGYDPNAKSLNGYTRNELAGQFAKFNIPKNIVFQDKFCILINKNIKKSIF